MTRGQCDNGSPEVHLTHAAARAGEPVARLVAVGKKRRLLLGRDEGLYELPDDFDAPLPAEVLEDFER